MIRPTLLAVLVTAMALTGTAFAQAQSTPSDAPRQHMHAMDPQQQLQHMTKALQLTPDQQAKIDPILQQRAQQIQALRADTTLKPADRRAKAMAIVQDSSKQIDAVLTDEQRARMKAMREKAMERMEEQRAQHTPASSRTS